MRDIYISSCNRDGGIYHYRLCEGKLLFRSKTDVDRPMYTVYRDGRLYVLLREVFPDGSGGVMSFSVKADGELADPSAVVSTLGECPCHLCVTNKDIYFANYQSGNVAALSGRADFHSGAGVDPSRQETAHTHFVGVSPDGKYLLSCDLGIDSIHTYDFELNVISVAKVPDGHGARHLAYSPDGKYVYCANELASTVSVFAYDNGRLTLGRTYSCVEDGKMTGLVAAIRVRDGRLYVSNRGEDTVVCFRIVGDSLELESRTAILGSYPRDFDFAGSSMICTNEFGNCITVFEERGEGFVMSDRIENVSAPLCVTVV